MRIRSLPARVGLSVVLGASLAIVLPTAAQASGGVAPSCVKRTVGSTGGMPSAAKVTVTNTCSGTKRVKVVFTHAHDSSCMSLARGRSRTVSSTIALPFSHYDKTVTC